MRRLALLVLLTISLCLACSSDDDDQPDATATPSPAPTATAMSVPEVQGTPPEGTSGQIPPPADHAPVAMRATQDVLTNGDALAFKMCSQEIGWQKPAPEAMTTVFHDLRFGDGIAPYPDDYTYYLRDFYFPTPFSNSANKYWTAFGGFALAEETEAPETFCDAQALRTQGLFRTIRTLDYSVTEVRRLDNTLVIVVEPGFEGWQETIFPYPPEQPVFRGDGIETVRVVDTDGDALFENVDADQRRGVGPDRAVRRRRRPRLRHDRRHHAVRHQPHRGHQQPDGATALREQPRGLRH